MARLREVADGAPRAGFSPNRINTLLALKNGSRSPGDIMAEIRTHAGDPGRAALLDDMNALFDVIVHSQDIAVPLRHEFTVPAEYCHLGLQRVWAMGWPFHARRKLVGFTLAATDTGWQAPGLR